MQARSFNLQAFTEFACYVLFGGLVLYLVISGKYLFYVTPRLLPYLCFMAIVMLVWAAAVFPRIQRPQHRMRFVHCFVIILPILLILLPHNQLSASDLCTNYTGMTLLGNTGSNSAQSAAIAPTPVPSSGNLTTGTPGVQSTPSSTALSPSEDSSAGLSGLDTANRRIVVSNEEFYPWLVELFGHTDKYTGYTITITGFVYRDSESFDKNEFVPVRLAMTCCTADLTPIGMLCIYDKASELKKDSWVTVEGVLFVGQYNGRDEPQIKVTNITPADEVKGYIYPY